MTIVKFFSVGDGDMFYFGTMRTVYDYRLLHGNGNERRIVRELQAQSAREECESFGRRIELHRHERLVIAGLTRRLKGRRV